MAERITRALVTIPNGAALSQEIDLAGHQLIALHMPALWTAANLTFKGKPKSTNLAATALQDVFNDAGTEVAATATASKYIALTGATLDALLGCERIQVRSGTTGVPVNQGADRVIVAVLAIRGS